MLGVPKIHRQQTTITTIKDGGMLNCSNVAKRSDNWDKAKLLWCVYEK
jgi:hypothetical protein